MVWGRVREGFGEHSGKGLGAGLREKFGEGSGREWGRVLEKFHSNNCCVV